MKCQSGIFNVTDQNNFPLPRAISEEIKKYSVLKDVRYIIILEKVALLTLSCENAFWCKEQSSVTFLLATL
jgi:hypothetical protein